MKTFRFEVVNFENGDKSQPVVTSLFEQSFDSEHDATVYACGLLPSDASHSNFRVDVYELITQVS